MRGGPAVASAPAASAPHYLLQSLREAGETARAERVVSETHQIVRFELRLTEENRGHGSKRPSRGLPPGGPLQDPSVEAPCRAALEGLVIGS